ncbi:hypothetical protein C0J52_22581 [Blattella germanica]|nr:hypothetical protein C0J52_22581 [Blattella germanica]
MRQAEEWKEEDTRRNMWWSRCFDRKSRIKSTRKRSAELGIPRTTMRDHMKKDLKTAGTIFFNNNSFL